MKWTPQNSITSASVAAACAREAERVADEVGDVLELGQLVVVGEDDGVALRAERAHLGRHALDLSARQLAAGGGDWIVGSSCIWLASTRTGGSTP